MATSTESRSRIKGTIIDSAESRAIVAGDSELPLRQPVGWRLGGDEEFAALSIEHCVRLADDGVLVAGWFLRSGAGQGSLSLTWADGPKVYPRSNSDWAKPRPDVVGGFAARQGTREALPDPDEVGFHLVVPGFAGSAREPRLEITYETGGEVSSLRARADDSTERVAALVHEEWAFVSRELAPRLRSELDENWWTALAHVSPELTDETGLMLSVDQSVAIPGSGPLLTGWCVNGTGEEIRIWLCTPGGQAEDLSERMIYVFRHDVHELHREQYDLRNLEQGLIAHAADLEVGEDEPVIAVVATPNEIVGRLVLAAPESSSVPMRDVEALLSLVGPSHPELRRVMDTVGPAVRRSGRTGRGPKKQIEVHDFGPVPSDPRLSIIVPIYGRWDFIEYQLALFAGDPEMREHELLYMIDDPKIFEAVHALRPQHPADVRRSLQGALRPRQLRLRGRQQRGRFGRPRGAAAAAQLRRHAEGARVVRPPAGHVRGARRRRRRRRSPALPRRLAPTRRNAVRTHPRPGRDVGQHSIPARASRQRPTRPRGRRRSTR